MSKDEAFDQDVKRRGRRKAIERRDSKRERMEWAKFHRSVDKEFRRVMRDTGDHERTSSILGG